MLGGSGLGDIWSNFDPETAPGLIKAARHARTNGASKLGGPRGTDQGWLHLMRGPETPQVGEADGVLYWQPGRYPTLPSYARMVTFAGPQKLSNWRVRRYSPWIERFYPGPKIDPSEPLPDGIASRAGRAAAMARGKRSILALEREARRRRMIRGGREFARAP